MKHKSGSYSVDGGNREFALSAQPISDEATPDSNRRNLGCINPKGSGGGPGHDDNTRDGERTAKQRSFNDLRLFQPRRGNGFHSSAPTSTSTWNLVGARMTHTNIFSASERPHSAKHETVPRRPASAGLSSSGIRRMKSDEPKRFLLFRSPTNRKRTMQLLTHPWVQLAFLSANQNKDVA